VGGCVGLAGFAGLVGEAAGLAGLAGFGVAPAGVGVGVVPGAGAGLVLPPFAAWAASAAGLPLMSSEMFASERARLVPVPRAID
jgi:hypothetical protein